MKHSRLDKKRFKEIADQLSLPQSEVERAVGSFFGSILSYARTLPFNNHLRIYKKPLFNTYVKAFNVPFIGRIGPAYSRYLRWRANESSLIQFKYRDDYKFRLSPEEVERLAEAFLSGASEIVIPKKKKNSELYNRVWLVDTVGKKSARQVIPK